MARRILEQVFQLQARGTTVYQEALAGLTTFLTMSYIVVVNPAILGSTGMDRGALVTATIAASVFGTVLVGVWANVPFAMAPGMGLNALFAYGLVASGAASWQTALGVVFLSGVLFLVLTALGFRRRIVEAIPPSLRLAVPAGIGLFIAFIGLQNLGLIVARDGTLVGLGALTPPVLCGLCGLLVAAVLQAFRFGAALLAGIAVAFVAGAAAGEVALPSAWWSLPPSLEPIAFELDVRGALQWSLAGVVFSFLFVDLFDSVGTVVACSYEAGLVDEQGKIERLDRVLEADAASTVVGAVIGTSTTTTYIESGTGIAAGGASGLTSVFTALFFLAALFFAPLVVIVPSFASAPALILVGFSMMKHVRTIDFARPDLGIPAFLTVALMPLTFSISTGLAFGFLSHLLLALATGRAREVPRLLWVIGALSLLSLLVEAG